MKTLSYAFLILIASVTLVSCFKDSCSNTMTYTQYVPVYVTPEEYRLPVQLSASQTLKNPGKIYFYKKYVFINEVREGIHVINNENPAQPINVGFIQIPGNVDMAVMNNSLYADGYTDLLNIDISDPQNPTLKQRKENVFNGLYFTDNNFGLLSHYEPTEVTQKIDCSSHFYGRDVFIAENGGVFFDSSLSNGNLSSSAGGNPQVGQAGSMARFTITKNHLYAVGEAEIFSIPIMSTGDVGEATTTSLPWGIETIYPFKNYLFLGANDGMHILDIDNPLQPKLRSSFNHARACDPVVVEGDIAYVTLRTGEFTCPGDRNELQVLDVSNIDSPKLLHSFTMQNPHGLGYIANQLYLCEGTHGLKIFDKTKISDIGKNMLSHIDQLHAWDVISLADKSILVIGHDGFYQYDCKNPSAPVLLSKIPVVR